MSPASYSSPSLVASVAASPSPVTSNNNSTFRSLRSLLPFGPSKNSNANPSSHSTPSQPKGAFSSFSSMRKSLTRDRERDRKNSLTNLLPVISIDRSSVNQSFGEGYARRAASYSHLEQQVTPQNQPRQILGEFGTLERHSMSEVAPLLRSISPGPPLSADLSTIIEGDSSCISKGDPLSSKPPTPSTGSPLLPSPHIVESIGGSETDANSFDLNSNQIAKEVYAAIAGENATEQWLAAEQPIVIDADTDDDMPFPPPPSSGWPAGRPGVNIENVDPSIVALLSPNNLPKRSLNVNVAKKPQQPLGSSMPGSSPSQPNSFSSNSPLNGGPQHRRVPTTSSIPRLRPMAEPTTPGSTSAMSAETTFKASSSSVMPVSNMQRIKPDVARQRRIASHSPLSTSETQITVNTNSPPVVAAATAIASPRSLARIFSYSPSIPQPVSPSSPSSAPPTPPVAHGTLPRIPTLATRLQINSSSEAHLKQSVPRTPSPTVHTPQLISTQASTSSVSTIPTAPHTPSTSGTSNASHTPGSPHTPNSVSRTAQSMSRQGSESSSVFQRRLHSRDGFDETVTTPIVGPDHYFGRASLDSRKPAQQQRKFQLALRVGGSSGDSEAHVLATSTPFSRSGDGVGIRRTQDSEIPTSSPAMAHETTEMEVAEGGHSTSPSLRSRKEGDGYHSASPSPPKLSGMLRPPFRSRKRSMSVQENHGVLQSLLGGRGGGKAEKGERMESVLLHHDASRSNTSLSGRLAGLKMKEDAREELTREDGDDSPVQRPPVHDWLGPRSVKALRAAGLLVDRDRDRDRDRDDPQLSRSSRERSGSVTTSVMSGGSGKASLGAVGRLIHSRSGGSEYGLQHGSPYQLQHHHSQGHGYYGLGHGRAPSRMAFSDAGGPTNVTSSRRGSGTFSHLMHSPTLTTSTSGSRDRDRERDRDTPRSAASTAPTSVSSASLAGLRERDRERDEIRELKDKHATETGALLGALSDSQRTTRILREENHDLREKLERLADAEAENEDLRREVRSLKREVNELKVHLLTGGSRGPSRMNSNGPATESGGSGLNTPVPQGNRRDMGSSSLEVSPQKMDVLRPPSWGRQTSTVSSAATSLHRSPTPESVPDAPRHRRCPSDTSSIFPVLPSNMSLLMHEEQELSNQTDENEQQGLSSVGTSPHGDRTLDQFSPPHHAQSQAQAAAAGTPMTRPRPLSLRKVTGPNGVTPASSRTRTSATSISPTTANFSMVTGSPGSLFLRPEHEVHLGDLETFSLDFGRAELEDAVGLVGGSGELDDW